MNSGKGYESSNRIAWRWPVQGRVIKHYSAKANSKHQGIDLSGKIGDSVLSSAKGKVVYAGSRLSGYGNLIIIKHNQTYLSAYAHNRRLLVKEGQWVSKGQKIAELGKSGAEKAKLHFQIRKDGKALNPLKLLPPRG